MAGIYTVNETKHKIKAKLYPNRLPGGEGTYVARTSGADVADIRAICASMRNRGGYEGSVEEALRTVGHFIKETEYLLCNGFMTDLDIFTVHVNIGGVFNSDKEAHDHEKHPLDFRFKPRKTLLDLRGEIEVDIDGYGDSHAYIGEFTDRDSGAVNRAFTPGGAFVLRGRKIKIAGDDPACGLYFVPVADPSAAVKAAHIGDSTPGKITGVIPPATGGGEHRLEVRTQYSGSGTILLKEIRVITSPFTLKQA
jgi:hypothetical protein